MSGIGLKNSSVYLLLAIALSLGVRPAMKDETWDALIDHWQWHWQRHWRRRWRRSVGSRHSPLASQRLSPIGADVSLKRISFCHLITKTMSDALLAQRMTIGAQCMAVQAIVRLLSIVSFLTIASSFCRLIIFSTKTINYWSVTGILFRLLLRPTNGSLDIWWVVANDRRNWFRLIAE